MLTNNQLANSFSISENVVIINQIIKLISSIKYKSDKKYGLLIQIFSLIPKIFSMIIIKYVLTNPEILNNKLKLIFDKLFYKKISFNSHYRNKLGQDIINEFTEYNNNNPNTSEIIVTTNTSKDNIIISYNKLFGKPAIIDKLINNAISTNKTRNADHALVFQIIKKMVNNNNNNRQNMDPKVKPSVEFNHIPLNANNLYPSRNYKEITNLINIHIRNSHKIGNYKILPCLIDGIPGLGKSDTIHYLAKNSELNYIFTVNMTNLINDKVDISDLNNYILEILNKSNRNTLILIDELDKYVDGAINNIENEKLNNVNITQLTYNILYSILELIDKQANYKFSIFIVFCSNNFNSIFSCLDNDKLRHFESFKDRFTTITYTPIDKQELIDYLTWNDRLINEHNDILENIYPDEFKLINELPYDFNMTYRKFNQLLQKSNYDIKILINKIINQEELNETPILSD